MGKKGTSRKKKGSAGKKHAEDPEEKAAGGGTGEPQHKGLMSAQARIVTKHPLGAVLFVLIVTALAIGTMTFKGLDTETSEGTFNPDIEIANMSEEVNERFTDSYSIMALVKAPTDDGSILTPGAFVELLTLEQSVLNDSRVQQYLYDKENSGANVVSPADMIGTFLMTNIKMMMGLNDTSSTQQELIGLFQGMDQAGFEENISSLFQNPYVPAALKVGLSFMFTKDFDPENGTISAKGTMLIFQFDTSLGDYDGDDMEVLITELIEDAEGVDYQYIEVTGFANKVINNEIMGASNQSMMWILPVSFILVALILSITYRDMFDIVISIAALGMSILWMYAFGAAMGFNFNPMTTAVPVLLVGLGIDYGIHVTTRYREEILGGKSLEGALRMVIISVGAALSLATVTTVVSFLSNLSSPMSVLREFGLLAVAGIVASFITMTVFVPGAKLLKDRWFSKKSHKLWGSPMMYFRALRKKEKTPAEEEKKERKQNIIEKVIITGTASGAIAAKKAPWLVIIIAIVITAAGAYGWSNVNTEFDFTDFLPEELDISKDFNFMLDNFQSSEETCIIYYKGDVTQPDVFADMEEVAQATVGTPHVINDAGNPRVTSLKTALYDLSHYSSGEGVTDFNFDIMFMPEYLQYFNYTSGLPLAHTTAADIEGLLDYIFENNPSFGSQYVYREDDGRYTASIIKVSVSIEYNDEEGLDQLEKDLDADASALKDSPHVDYLIVTGGPIVQHVVLNAINDTQIQSIGITFIASALVLMIVFIIETRRLKLDVPRWLIFGSTIGLLTMLPVTLCMVWITGTMYALDINLDVMTITITALTIGLGITYGIHYSHRFLEDLVKHKDVFKALRDTSEHTGLALLGAAMTTMAGFGMLFFSLLPPMKNFGSLTALTILYSFIATVMILPSLLGIWGRLLGKRGVLAEEPVEEEEKDE